MNGNTLVNELLQNIGQLNSKELDEFFIKLQTLYVQKQIFDLQSEEQNLLKKIKTKLPTAKQMRYEFLIARRDAYTLSEQEYDELLTLTESIEKQDTIRLKRIAKLADLKNMSLPEVVSTYGLQPN